MDKKIDILKASVLNEIRNHANKQHTITSRELCSNFNLSFRQLKEVITELRKDGYPIVAKETDGGGYWLAENELDIIDFINMIGRRKRGYEETIVVMNDCLSDFGNIPTT